MKLPLTSNQYLILVTLIYVLASLAQLFVVQYTQIEVIQLGWVLSLVAPMLLPLSKLVDLSPFWRKDD